MGGRLADPVVTAAHSHSPVLATSPIRPMREYARATPADEESSHHKASSESTGRRKQRSDRTSRLSRLDEPTLAPKSNPLAPRELRGLLQGLGYRGFEILEGRFASGVWRKTPNPLSRVGEALQTPPLGHLGTSPGRDTRTPPTSRRRQVELGAEDGIRTRDPHLGKVMLYH